MPSDVVFDAAEIAAERNKFLHQLLVYIVAFGLIGMYWAQHGVLFGGLRNVDRRLVVLNLLFLFPVTLLPFVTQLMGARRDDWRVVLVFALTNLAAASLVGRQWKHVLALPETHAGPKTARIARRIVVATRFYALVLTSGAAISFLDVRAGIAVMLIMPFAFFVNFARMGSS